MERDSRALVATFYVDAPLARQTTAVLAEHAAHHARVKRMREGDGVCLTNGVGTIARGAISRLRRDAIDVEIDGVDIVSRAPAIHLRVPIGDRERMLWLAEKATELAVDTWQAVRFRRSMSVSPRGEGAVFAGKVRARMVNALEQSGGAWLPEILPETTADALTIEPAMLPIVLDVRGAPLASVIEAAPHAAAPIVVFGPEGGLDEEELARFIDSGWRAASLTHTTLRFETAGIAAIAVLRACRRREESSTNGR